jgi:hypothetical protein
MCGGVRSESILMEQGMKCQTRVFAAATDCIGRKAVQIGSALAVLERTTAAGAFLFQSEFGFSREQFAQSCAVSAGLRN